MSPYAAHPDSKPADRRSTERSFCLAMLLVVWAAILSGFAYNNISKFYAGTLTYPWIVHVHALAFSAWLVLFTAQVLLVRRGRLAAHRRMGQFAAWLTPLMVILGVSTAIITEKLKFGTLVADTRFLSVNFADMLAFGGLAGAGMLLRRRPEAHKRLMLLATIVLTDAGFGRWLSPAIGAWMQQRNYWELRTLSEGAWPFVRFQLLPVYVLIAAVGIFDIVTRRRVERAYLWAVAWCLCLHLLAGWLYFQPFWNDIALKIIGR